MKNVKIYGILSVYWPALLVPTNTPKRPFVKIYRQFGLRLDKNRTLDQALNSREAIVGASPFGRRAEGRRLNKRLAKQGARPLAWPRTGTKLRQRRSQAFSLWLQPLRRPRGPNLPICQHEIYPSGASTSRLPLVVYFRETAL